MSATASQITSLTIVYSTVYSRHRSKKTSKLCVTGLCAGNSPVTGEFPAQRASSAENVSIWWRHHAHNGELLAIYCGYFGDNSSILTGSHRNMAHSSNISNVNFRGQHKYVCWSLSQAEEYKHFQSRLRKSMVLYIIKHVKMVFWNCYIENPHDRYFTIYVLRGTEYS